MKIVQGRILIAILSLWADFLPGASLDLVAGSEPPCVFAGADRKIPVEWRNSSDAKVTINLRLRLYQATTATAVRWSELPWKVLEALPEQTVLETVRVTFPEVKGETRFIIKWFDESGTDRGTSPVLVYPPDLLKELKLLAGDEAIGLFDPATVLKPLFKNLAVEFLDLEESGVTKFSGKLAVIGPFQSDTPIRAGLEDDIAKLADKGAAVVWLQPPDDAMPGALPRPLKPTFYIVPSGRGNVLVAQASLVPELAANPLSQQRLIQLARVAVRPEPLRLPTLNTSPR